MSNFRVKLAFHLKRLRALNAELSRYTPAILLKQAATYPTTHNKQACAYYLLLEKQAGIEKRALVSLLKLLGKGIFGTTKLVGRGIGGTYRLAEAGVGAAAPHIVNAVTATGRGGMNFMKHHPGKGALGVAGLTLAGQNYAYPVLKSLAESIIATGDEGATGISNFLKKLRNSYQAFDLDPNYPVISGSKPPKPIPYIHHDRGLDFIRPPEWKPGTRGEPYPDKRYYV